MKSASNIIDPQMGQHHILEHKINHLRKIDMIEYNPNEPVLCWGLGIACIQDL